MYCEIITMMSPSHVHRLTLLHLLCVCDEDFLFQIRGFLPKCLCGEKHAVSEAREGMCGIVCKGLYCDSVCLCVCEGMCVILCVCEGMCCVSVYVVYEVWCVGGVSV